MLTTLLAPTFLSNSFSLFLTYQLTLFSSLLTQLSQLIRPLPPFFLDRYILATSLLGCSSLFIVMISSTSFIVCPFINFPHFYTTSPASAPQLLLLLLLLLLLSCTQFKHISIYYRQTKIYQIPILFHSPLSKNEKTNK